MLQVGRAQRGEHADHNVARAGAAGKTLRAV